MKYLLAVALMVLASFATAQGFPARYNVTGVSAQDTLNVRVSPDPSSEVIDELLPYDRDVEVLQLSANNQWGKIGGGESNGWVAMRYMQRSDETPDGEMPRPMTCLGTEPFWTLSMTDNGAELEEFGLDSYSMETVTETTSQDGQGFYGQYAEEDTATYSLMIQRRLCNDGMTDRDYGFRALLFANSQRGNTMKSGCCTLDGR